MNRRALLPILAALLVASGPARAADPVLLVQGTASLTDAGERAYAESVTKRLAAWLTEVGIPHRVVPDEQVASSLGSGCRVALLGYNPNPPAGEVAALGQFLRRGGKLLVCYSSHAGLAEAMGLRMGEYKASGTPARWREMQFGGGAPPQCPPRVRQRSRNIRPVYPAGRGSHVIAQWADASGRALGDPACLRSDRGYWLTHILLDDMDVPAKQQLLLALLADLDGGLWRAAAERAVARIGRIGRYGSLDQAVAGLRPRVEALGSSAVARDLAACLARERELRGRLGSGDPAGIVSESRALRGVFMAVYGRTAEPRAGEIHGVWDHSGLGLFPGDWERTCRTLARHGIGDLFTNVLWPGSAHCRSAVLAPSPEMTVYGDQLAQCLAAADRHGLRVHAWKVCWRLDHAPAAYVARMRREGRLQVTDTGQELAWLCPSHPENRRDEKDAIRELISRYGVHGVHLDYVRYPDSRSCFCSGCRRRFESSLGHAVGAWPEAATRPPLRDRYRAWRAEQITAFVRDVRALMRAAKPDLRLSAAVYGRYPICVASVAQDWARWAREDLLDWVCPMNYTDDPVRFQAYLAQQVSLPGVRERLVSGVGVTAAECRLGPVQVIDQVEALRRWGARGFVLFDLNPTLAEETLPILRLGITARPR